MPRRWRKAIGIELVSNESEAASVNDTSTKCGFHSLLRRAQMFLWVPSQHIESAVACLLNNDICEAVNCEDGLKTPYWATQAPQEFSLRIRYTDTSWGQGSSSFDQASR